MPRARGQLSRAASAVAVGWLAVVLAIPVMTAGTGDVAAQTRAPGGSMRVLVLADSHSLGPFGEKLDQWLFALPGAEVHTWAIGGSSPGWWFNGNLSNHAYDFHSGGGPLPARKTLKHRSLHAPLLADLLKPGAYDRELIIISQGSNVPGATDVYRGLSERLVKAIHADGRPRTCVWIGPPTMRAHGARYAEEVVHAIDEGLRAAARAGAPCTLIDSRKLSEYPDGEGDGVHYPFTRKGIAAANRWADGTIAALAPLVPAPPSP